MWVYVLELKQRWVSAQPGVSAKSWREKNAEKEKRVVQSRIILSSDSDPKQCCDYVSGESVSCFFLHTHVPCTRVLVCFVLNFGRFVVFLARGAEESA